MEAPANSQDPYYGWGSFKNFEKKDDFKNHKMIGTYSAMEGKGMSGKGGKGKIQKMPKGIL